MKPHFSPSSIPIALIMRENGRSLRFPKILWSNDKKIIELGYRKISWYVSVSQIIVNYWEYTKKVITISSFLEIDFAINISDKKSRRFDLSEVIFKCIKVL